MDKPFFRSFTDTERLDWLMEFIKTPLVSRNAIDEAIARDEWLAEKKRSESRSGSQT